MTRRKIFGRILLGTLLLSWLMACTQVPEAPSAPTIATPSPLPNGIAGRSYAVGLKAARGEPPLNWSGRPAAGLALDARSGELMGTPEHAGSFQFPVTVTDGRARSHTKTFDLTVVSFPSGALAITSPSPLPQGIRGRAYLPHQLEASGGRGLRWSSGNLADDFTLDPQGIVTATPKRDGTRTLERVGTFTFDVSVTDEEKHCSAKRFQLTVIGLDIVTRDLPAATPGTDYAASVTAEGGIPPLTWSLASGALPGGLNLDGQTGKITGKPTSASATPFRFEVMVTDSPAQSDTQALQISVREPGVTVRMENLLFMPPAMEVKVGDTVVWEHHQGQTPHTVTSGMFSAPDAGQLFDSRGGNSNARMREPDKFSHRFDTAGTFPYHCVVHGSPDTSDPDAMNGTITVKP